MKTKNLLLPIIIALIFFSCNNSKYDYPETKKVDIVDNYFGTEVPDPYRWLESDTSHEVKEWVKKQNKVTFNYLKKIPFRQKLTNRLSEIWNYKKVSTPRMQGGKYFYFKNDGLQNHDVLFMKEDLQSKEQMVLNPNTFSEDGSISLASYKASHDGKYLAYSVSKSGSDWEEIHVKNLQTGATLDDHLKWIKFSNIAWYKDGFFYSRYEKPEEGKTYSQVNTNQKVYYHKIGTKQSEDRLVFNKPNYPKRNYTADVSRDEKYLYIYESKSTHGNNILVKNLKKDDNFVKLTTSFKYEYNIIGHSGDQLIVHTNYRAPKYKVVRIDVQKKDVGNWLEIIPEQKNVLQDVEVAGNRLITSYMKDAHNQLKVYSHLGEELYEIDLPGLGSVTSISGIPESNKMFYSFSSFTVPTQVWQHNLETEKSKVYFKPELDINSDQYVTEQVFYESKDKTKIPMFLVHKKGIKKDGTNPVFLYGYGGFNASLTPRFNQSNMLWLENGGIYALANIRGGGEYGEKWHKQGMRLNKQNVFEDFISAAEYLVDNNYTNKDKMAIHGASNGGLLVGAVTNQRPNLFEVAVPQVGVMDMLRYHKFTIGWAWVDEYGSSKDSLHFKNLYDYSPLHNIQDDKEYPAVLVMTSANDDRVVPAHSYKYIATLQEKYDGDNPTMIRIQTKAGHGSGKATEFKIQEEADMWSFIFKNMEIKPKY